MNGVILTLARRLRITGLVFSALHNVTWKAHLWATAMFALATSQMSRMEFPMSAHDLPATARALSFVVAIALVATALAPVIFTAARIVA
jgi:hypothetical protein